MEVSIALFVVVPAVIHAKVVVYQQDDPPYERGVVWTPYNTTSLWFLPVTEGVTITARYNDGLVNKTKWFDKHHFNTTTGLWTRVTIHQESSNKSKLELYFENSNYSMTLKKFNTGDPGNLWSVHLEYKHGTIIWAEQDPQLINSVGFVYESNSNISHLLPYKRLSNSTSPAPSMSTVTSTSDAPPTSDAPSASDADCSCVLPVLYWLMGIILLIIILGALAAFFYKYMRKHRGSGSVLARSSKYEVTVTRTSINRSASALSVTDLQTTRISTYMPSEGQVTKPYETTLRPPNKSKSRPHSTPVLTSRHYRPQSQFIISEKHPIPCTMVVHPPTPPNEEVVTLGPASSMGSLRPYAESLGDSDDFSSFSDRSSADGESRCSVNNSLNT